MALHGLAHAVIGVPDVDVNRIFYRDFGLVEGTAGRFSTSDGGEQLRLVEQPLRGLVEIGIAADDHDDLARIRRAAQAHGVEVADDGDDVILAEPVLGFRARVTIRPRVEQVPSPPVLPNRPGVAERGSARAPGIYPPDAVQPRRLGHVLYATSDLEASSRFLREVLGFRLTDSVPGVIEFLRCSTDHHNIGLIASPTPHLHHSSWQVDDVDQIGHGAHRLLGTDPTCDVWGLGRHFLGSNYFWYLRDPAGNYAEYFADLDQIVDDAEWMARTWDPDKALYAWGPPVPPAFLEPIDLDELSAAYVAAGAS